MNMTEGREVAQWIRSLADSDPLKRHVAATHLHLTGAALVVTATREWFRDAEFRELVRPFSIDADGKQSSEHTYFSIGIAVQPENFERIRAANGSPRLAEVPPDQDAMEFELRSGAHEEFDILTTRDPSGPGAIARYLNRFGEGIQQIEVNVTSVNRATEILRTRFGLTPVYPETHAGANGARVNFFLVPVVEGKRVLIELVEPAPKG
ncbi:MAG TPA: hypothetical protein VGR97_13925 [Candidatus Acidoferrales bacterium]|nr:hypothetical protein [Candidatus Acidoferrales bacterium]